MTPDNEANNQIRVLIADDHGLMRAGLRHMLQTEPDILVAGEAADGQQTLDLAHQLQPDVILLDISMPPPDGIEVARRLKLELPKVRALMLTMHEDPNVARESFAAGAAGYIIKRAAERELIGAIRMVARGEVYVYEPVRLAAPAPSAGNGDGHEVSGRAVELSEPELTLLRLLAGGRTRQDIARALGVTVEQTEQMRQDLLGRLGLRTRIDIMKFAQQRGLL